MTDRKVLPLNGVIVVERDGEVWQIPEGFTWPGMPDRHIVEFGKHGTYEVRLKPMHQTDRPGCHITQIG